MTLDPVEEASLPSEEGLHECRYYLVYPKRLFEFCSADTGTRLPERPGLRHRRTVTQPLESSLPYCFHKSYIGAAMIAAFTASARVRRPIPFFTEEVNAWYMLLSPKCQLQYLLNFGGCLMLIGTRRSKVEVIFNMSTLIIWEDRTAMMDLMSLTTRVEGCLWTFRLLLRGLEHCHKAFLSIY